MNNKLLKIQKEFSTKAFINSDKPGDYWLRKSMLFNEELINYLTEIKIINKKESKFLLEMLNTEDNITVGQKRRIKNILMKKIKVYVDSEDLADYAIDLNLPDIDEIMTEVKREKLPVNLIISNIRKKNNAEAISIENDNISVEAPVVSEVKSESTSESDSELEIESTNSTAQSKTADETQENYNGTCKVVYNLLDTPMLKAYKYFKNMLYNKDKVDVFTDVKIYNILKADKNEDEFNKIKNSSVDFVIFNADTMEIICAVIMSEDVDIKSTQAFATAGIKLFRLRWILNGALILNNYDLRVIEEEINNKLAPKCPLCGLPMQQKENIKNRHRFYACMDNINCRYTINID